MCASCGCGKPEDQMGDERNIVWRDVEQAAEAAGITPQEVAENILQASRQQAG